MAFENYSSFLSKFAATMPYPTKQFASRIAIAQVFTGVGGSIPTTAAQCFDTTEGALVSPIPTAAGALYLASMFVATANALVQPGLVTVNDRLSHMGGLSGIVTGEQTTNLPTAALPRYTNGVGVQIAIDVYTGLGTTATTLTARYTNSDGVANRTTKPIVIPTSLAGAQRRFLPLQDGDVGVLSVEGVTLAASTGTAGNFGITLIKPLAMPRMMTDIFGEQREAPDVLYGGLPEVKPGACLELTSFFGYNSNTINGLLRFLEA